MTDLIVISITTPDEEIALSIGDSLVKDGLVACAQVDGPIMSIYEWKGTVHHDEEWRLVLKSSGKLFSSIVTRIKQLHPYDLPQIVATPIVLASDEYAQWVLDQVGSNK